MASKTAFVSSADANYFHLLVEWLQSVRRFPQSANVDICIMDAGMTEEQLAQLTEAGCKIVCPEWPIPLPKWRTRGRDYLKSCICRPFIPDYFPGYETYFWMDADTWVQRWDVIELFLYGAARRKITLTAQVDRAYPRPVRVKWMGPWPRKIASFYYNNARKAYGWGMARELASFYVLSAGAFALRGDAPHWKAWQEQLKESVERGDIFPAEQLSLGIMCHLQGYPTEILPSWTHWMCQFKPMWDEERSLFVEPYLPHEPLGILHLSGVDEMRMDRAVTTNLKTLRGGDVQLSYRFR